MNRLRGLFQQLSLGRLRWRRVRPGREGESSNHDAGRSRRKREPGSNRLSEFQTLEKLERGSVRHGKR